MGSGAVSKGVSCVVICVSVSVLSGCAVHGVGVLICPPVNDAGAGGAVGAGVSGGAVPRALFAYERVQSWNRCPLTPQRLQGCRSRHALVLCSPPQFLHLTTVQAAAKWPNSPQFLHSLGMPW